MRESPKKPVSAVAATAQGGAVGGEPVSYIGNEMGGYGDAGYSFIDSDTSTGGNGGASIPGTFEFLKGASAQGPGQMQAQPSRSKKEAMFDQQFDLYKQQRDTGMPRGPMRQ